MVLHFFIQFEDSTGAERKMKITEKISVILMLVKHTLTVIYFVYIYEINVKLFKRFEKIDCY